MTNYNERLTTELVKLQGRAIKDWESDLAKAKATITSLIKELVAEAKPCYKPISKYAASTYNQGFNQAVDELEQNLLKALEEL